MCTPIRFFFPGYKHYSGDRKKKDPSGPNFASSLGGGRCGTVLKGLVCGGCLRARRALRQGPSCTECKARMPFNLRWLSRS